MSIHHRVGDKNGQKKNPQSLRYIIRCLVCRCLTTYLTQKSLVDGTTGFNRRFWKDTETLNLVDRCSRTRLRFFLRARLRIIVEFWKDKCVHIYARSFTWSLLFLLLFIICRRIIYVVKRSFTRNSWYFRC